MKVKIKNVIAAVTATLLIGSAVGVGTYAITANGSSSNFGFKGVYSLEAFADETTPETTTITVGDKTVNVSTTNSVVSTDGDYILYITAIDVDDLTGLTDVVVGYNYNGKDYNGKSEGLSEGVYSSVTVKTGEDSSITLQADKLNVEENFTDTKFIVAEVAAVDGAADADLSINKHIYYNCSQLIPSNYESKKEIIAKGASKQLNSTFTVSAPSDANIIGTYGTVSETNGIIRYLSNENKNCYFDGGIFVAGTKNLSITVNKAGKLTIYYGAVDTSGSANKTNAIVIGDADTLGGTNTAATATTIGSYTVDVTGEQIITLNVSSNRMCVYALDLQYE